MQTVAGKCLPPFVRLRRRFGRQAVLGFLVALFGLVLPFICWGALATPGHPHSGPHFVFAAPPAAARVQEADVSPHAHHANYTPTAPQTSSAQTPAAQSLPDLTLAIVAMLMLLVAWTFRVHLPVSTVCTSILLHGARYFARVPTPPPQLTCYA